MDWFNHDIRYSKSNPPKTAEQSREVIAFLNEAAAVPECSLMLSELLYTEEELIFHLTVSVEDGDDQLLHDELQALKAIRAQPRNRKSLMFLDTRIGELQIHFENVSEGKDDLRRALIEARLFRNEEVKERCKRLLSGGFRKRDQ